MELEQQFLQLKKINQDKKNPDRRELARSFFETFPKTEDNSFKRLRPIDKEVVKLLVQYAFNISEDNSKNIESLETIIKRTNILIGNAATLRQDRLINNILIELDNKVKELSDKKSFIFHSQESAKISALLHNLTIRSTADKEKREKERRDEILNAAWKKLSQEYIDKYGNEKGVRLFLNVVEQYNKHVELYNIQMNALNRIRNSLITSCSKPCINLLNELFIENPILPCAKYLPKEGGSKKSKTRRRRRN